MSRDRGFAGGGAGGYLDVGQGQGDFLLLIIQLHRWLAHRLEHGCGRFGSGWWPGYNRFFPFRAHSSMRKLKKALNLARQETLDLSSVSSMERTAR